MNRAFWSTADFDEAEWMGKAAAFSEKVMDKLGLDSWDLSLCFCSNAYMAKLNREYRNKDGTTDVLSFICGEWAEIENENRYIAGDVVLCPDAIFGNAGIYGISMDEELERVIIHGILHLSGMDHGTNDAAEPMLAEQERLLKETIEDKILL